MNYLLIPLTAFMSSCILIYFILRLPSRVSVLDKPNHRSLHTTPVSRLGGIGILFGLVVAFVIGLINFTLAREMYYAAAGLLMIASISFLDDIFSLSSMLRMLVQLLASSIVVYAGFIIDISAFPLLTLIPMAASIFVTIVYIVWMVNLYNFMDGIDGLAGGMAVFGFGTFAIIGFVEGEVGFAISGLIVASSSLGFLVWNYPPARIFMGDSGSSSLGFLAAILSIWAHLNGTIPIWISLVIFSPFIVDATTTLINRIIKWERFWDAHKSHYYQLIAESGLDRKKLVNFEYALMLLCSVIAIISYNASFEMQILFIIMLAFLYVFLMRYATRLSVKNTI